MEFSIVARSEETGALDISKKIIHFTNLHGSEELLEDIEAIIELLKKLGYKID